MVVRVLEGTLEEGEDVALDVEDGGLQFVGQVSDELLAEILLLLELGDLLHALLRPIHHVLLDLLHHVLVHPKVLGPLLGALEAVDVLVDDADLLVNEALDGGVGDGHRQGEQGQRQGGIGLNRRLHPVETEHQRKQAHAQKGDDHGGGDGHPPGREHVHSSSNL